MTSTNGRQCGIELFLTVFYFSLLEVTCPYILCGHLTENILENVLTHGTDTLECIFFACGCIN